MTVQVVSPAPRDLWRDLLRSDPSATPTQTPDWLDAVCRTVRGTDASRAYEFLDGRRLVLPLVSRRRAGARLTEESMPYGFGYGGVVAPGGRTTERERRAVLADLAGRPVVRAALNPSPAAAAPWTAAAPASARRVPFLSHVIDLAGGFDAVTGRYRSDIRRNVRKAERQPLDVARLADDRLVDTFAHLNAQSVDRWARQRGQPLWLARLVERQRDRARGLRSVLARPGSGCVGWTAHLDGAPVAAYVAVMSGESAFFWMSAMDQELSNRTRAGALLQSLAIEHACGAGARCFHLGESDPGSGVARFKEGFGGVPVAHEALRFERLPLTAADERLRAAVGRLTSGRGSAAGRPSTPLTVIRGRS